MDELYAKCPLCGCAMVPDEAGRQRCCLCGHTDARWQPDDLRASVLARCTPVELPVLTDLFDETPIPRRVYLASRSGKIEALLRGRSIIEEAVIGEGVREIGPYAFAGYEKLSRVSFPQSLCTIGEGAFLCCRRLETPVFPEKIREIGHWAFGKTAVDPRQIALPRGVELGRDALPPPYDRKGVWP